MQETIGQKLKKERKARFLTIEKVAEETRIRKIFLQALEADDYSVMPSAAQGRGFLRNYAEYLQLDIDTIIADLQKNPLAIENVNGPLPQVNLQETEIPPLHEEDEKPAPRFWSRWLGAKPQGDATPEATPLAVDELFADKNQLPEENQLEVDAEAKPNFITRIISLVKSKTKEVKSVGDTQIKPEDVVEKQLPTLPADLIFAEIGAQLRERRELISLTIEEVERHTKLRAPFIKALEEGSFEKLPSPVQTRGMVQNYATFLDLDADKILLRFADALQARRHEKYAETPREKIQTRVNASIPLFRTFIASDLIFGLGMIVILVALAIFGVGRVLTLQEEQNVEPTLIPFVDVFNQPSPTPSAELTFAPVNDPSIATLAGDTTQITLLAPSPQATANVIVNLFALERVFVRVSVDGEIVYEGRMSPKETQVFQAENQIVVLTGNGSALRVTYNGTDLGLMGGAGEVINRVYLITGVATPTATIPPTATNTPLVTVTPTPTFTPTPSVTPTESQ